MMDYRIDLCGMAENTHSDDERKNTVGDHAPLFVFNADDGVHGHEPWVTDGTADSTRLLVDINPGSVGSFPSRSTPLGDGRAVFSADDGVHGTELWITDGTSGGT